jgi:hypothetical protein
LGNDTSVGVFDSDLPPSVEFLPIAPTNISHYLGTNEPGGFPDRANFVQGVGMNQDMKVFSQPMAFLLESVSWASRIVPPFGLSTNWNIPLRSGDSSAPGRILVGNELILVTHNSGQNQILQTGGGPNYSTLFKAINQGMHFLSTNNGLSSDYQLSPFSLTNWPVVN